MEYKVLEIDLPIEEIDINNTENMYDKFIKGKYENDCIDLKIYSHSVLYCEIYFKNGLVHNDYGYAIYRKDFKTQLHRYYYCKNGNLNKDLDYCKEFVGFSNEIHVFQNCDSSKRISVNSDGETLFIFETGDIRKHTNKGNIEYSIFKHRIGSEIILKSKDFINREFKNIMRSSSHLGDNKIRALYDLIKHHNTLFTELNYNEIQEILDKLESKIILLNLKR